ncbi:DUF4265 domain-containing protein [Streptomyces lanatus]|uniref:DUF4265 domain-containing protein n=2 Tax=Streptomyces lanatus TaxID=66900 RepID=UPI00167CD134|nr:DUF4265 domain-containing protein [Streptomyces lanatus]GHG92824.1 hypothetical protein GCM10018780_14720 [Streptomyces lanatus]
MSPAPAFFLRRPRRSWLLWINTPDLTVKTKSGKAESLVSTTTHPFWSDSENAWIEAGFLKPGMRLHTADGESVEITAVHAFDRRQRTHDLTVEDVHTYYVLTEEIPLLVHNCGNHPDDRAGDDFTDAGRQQVYDENLKENDGVLTCDYCGRTVERRASRDADGTPHQGTAGRRPDRPRDSQGAGRLRVTAQRLRGLSALQQGQVREESRTMGRRVAGISARGVDVAQSSERPVSASGAKLFKVAFDLDAEHANWPPVSVERLWGEKTDVRFEIKVVNTPFFVRGISYGDLIRVQPDHERRELVFESFTSESGHSTIRVVFLRSGVREPVELRLSEAGCSWETTRGFENLLAVDIPPTAAYGELRQWLRERVDSGDLEIQESAISAIHRRQMNDAS